MHRVLLLLFALSFAAGVAQADDKFQRKSGLWEVNRTSTLAEGKIRVSQLCIDQASDDALRQLPDGPGNRCKVDKTHRDGDKLVVDAVCELSHTETTATTHAVVTGNPDSAYKIESKSTFDPPFRGKTEASTVLEAKWKGACKPDMRPGDVIMPNGTKMNVAVDEKAAADRAKVPRSSRSDAPATTKQKGGYNPPVTK
jgi:hypothetical protein